LEARSGSVSYLDFNIKGMDTMMIYMRKAGIDIKNSARVLDGLQTHGIQTAVIIELKAHDK
jgi:hypothetical protein